MRALVLALAVTVAAASATSCGGAAKTTSRTTKHKKRSGSSKTVAIGTTQHGKATWYGSHSQGGPTASGERFDRNKLTAAHRTFPMNTRVRVTHARTGKSVVVRINDRGPYGGGGRIIDVSEAAAKKLGIIREGVAPVTIEVVP